MTCRQFEDEMQSEFGSADTNQWQELIRQGAWDQLPKSDYTEVLWNGGRDGLKPVTSCV
jgi:hypothetical protein